MGIVGDEARRELIVALDKLRGDSGNVCGDGDNFVDWDRGRLKLLFWAYEYVDEATDECFVPWLFVAPAALGEGVGSYPIGIIPISFHTMSRIREGRPRVFLLVR